MVNQFNIRVYYATGRDATDGWYGEVMDCDESGHPVSVMFVDRFATRQEAMTACLTWLSANHERED